MSLRILVIPDKFKGSLSAAQAARAMAIGARKAHPGALINVMPMTDGGEGFVELLTSAAGGIIAKMRTLDPRGRVCTARYGVLKGGHYLVGLSEASGFWRVPAEARSAGKMSTEGSGRILAKLIADGAKSITVGLGGSSSNEGGIGLAAACGYTFLDAENEKIPLNGFSLARLYRISSPLKPYKTKFIAASDVDNPLCGKNGASMVFGPQKGATPDELRTLDRNLRRLCRISKRDLGHSQHDAPGAGAAGGAGYGLLNFFHAERRAGFDVFAEAVGLEELIKNHDLIITGEGALDDSSLGGKGPVSVAAMAAAMGKPIIAICGKCGGTRVRKHFQSIGEIASIAINLEDAMNNADRHVRELARHHVHKHSS